ARRDLGRGGLGELPRGADRLLLRDGRGGVPRCLLTDAPRRAGRPARCRTPAARRGLSPPALAHFPGARGAAEGDLVGRRRDPRPATSSSTTTDTTGQEVTGDARRADGPRVAPAHPGAARPVPRPARTRAHRAGAR